MRLSPLEKKEFYNVKQLERYDIPSVEKVEVSGEYYEEDITTLNFNSTTIPESGTNLEGVYNIQIGQRKVPVRIKIPSLYGNSPDNYSYSLMFDENLSYTHCRTGQNGDYTTIDIQFLDGYYISVNSISAILGSGRGSSTSYSAIYSIEVEDIYKNRYVVKTSDRISVESTTLSKSFTTSEKEYKVRRILINMGKYGGTQAFCVYDIDINPLKLFRYNKTYKNDFKIPYDFTNLKNGQRILIDTDSIDIDNVVENTLNDININKILLPNTKYEVLYNENTNKINVVTNKILFDITLTEAVNTVELKGLCKMIEYDKFYVLSVYSYCEDTFGSSVYFGNGSVINLTEENKRHTFIFQKIKEDEYNDQFLIAPFSDSSSKINLMYQENVRIYNQSYNFLVGTRIVIQEV